jgi:hypothetical protein
VLRTRRSVAARMLARAKGIEVLYISAHTNMSGN